MVLKWLPRFLHFIFTVWTFLSKIRFRFTLFRFFVAFFSSLRCGMSFNFIRGFFIFRFWILFFFSRYLCTAYRIFGSAFFIGVGSWRLALISSRLTFLFSFFKLDWVLSVFVWYWGANRSIRVVNYSKGRILVRRKFGPAYLLFRVILSSGCRLLSI